MCVFVADAEMRYVAVNSYACELLGYTEAELLDMRVPDIATSAEAPDEYAAMRAAAYLQGLSTIRCKDGDDIALHYVAGEVDIEGEKLYISIGRPDFT